MRTLFADLILIGRAVRLYNGGKDWTDAEVSENASRINNSDVVLMGFGREEEVARYSIAELSKASEDLGWAKLGDFQAASNRKATPRTEEPELFGRPLNSLN
jgi:hypothetical protein